MKYLQLRKRR